MGIFELYEVTQLRDREITADVTRLQLKHVSKNVVLMQPVAKVMYET